MTSKKKKKKRGSEGAPGSLQLHPRGVHPQALHWRHDDMVKLKTGAGNGSSASVLIIKWICRHSVPPAWLRAQKWSWRSLVELAWASQVCLLSGFPSACHQVTFYSLCAALYKLFVQKDSCELVLVREVRIRPGLLSSLLFILLSPGSPNKSTSIA